MPTQHKCPENSFADKSSHIRVLYGPLVDDGWESWILQHTWIAGEKEVYDGKAEAVGETMSESQFAISCCPFCGLELENPVE
jgi:hypothetical protein